MVPKINDFPATQVKISKFFFGKFIKKTVLFPYKTVFMK